MPTEGTNDLKEYLFQVLFGRYAKWENIAYIHFVILGAVLSLMVWVYVLCLRHRLNQYQKEREKVPKRHQILLKSEMSRVMWDLMINELDRAQDLISKIEPVDAGNGDLAWGKEDTPMAGTHFNTSVARSFYRLGKEVVSRRPGLFHHDYRTIRDYVAALRKAFPGLRHEVCQEYINTYERAVFSQEKLTESDWVRFKAVLCEIVGVINEKTVQTTDIV
eukprot:TRINITY_DN12343_c0_g1_i1.p1 TRINITY_DN12343_c0_g1~~TRINITY_DN12343_c0_g1_i1.p1  ORF type:complete len:219 (-),score=31.85 TRINITY_DN12343_c0_g1_i1:247-903(-)